MSINAHPLSWPVGWPRTDRFKRKHGQFRRFSSRVGIGEATERILAELKRFGVSRDDIVISTNADLRMDGLPRSDREPSDPGAAVYWKTRRDKSPKVMAIDAYHTLADNLAAIAATLDAMRAIERHGGAQILDRAFTGFQALPAPVAERSWREMLGIPADAYVTQDELDLAYKRARSAAHPDRPGGTAEAYNDVERAYAAAATELNLVPGGMTIG